VVSQANTVFRRGELVVAGTSYDARLYFGNGEGIEHSAEGTGRIDIYLRCVPRADWNRLRTEPALCLGDPHRINIRYDELRSRFV
jgi:hypothetical protein